MPSIQEIATTAAKGIDTQDFLDHIAWTDVIKPRLEACKLLLTNKLVNAVLVGAPVEEASKERIAGQIYGIDFAIKEIEKIVSQGQQAEDLLAKADIHLADVGV